jgi:drug/metabolite transporter (DMT)-like permease
MHVRSPRLRRKTQAFVVLVILSSLLGNLSLSLGLRQTGRVLSVSPLDYLRALTNPWVALGAAILILWLLSQMILLSWADLSYVLPITSIGYVLTALLGRWLLHEQISPARWAGILLIVAGVAVVQRTAYYSAGAV